MSIAADDLFTSLSPDNRIWLFLDYDGTLAEFAPTPDHIEPQADVIDLVKKVAEHPRIRLAVISGRRLQHVQSLLPISGILLAGTYGVEMSDWNGDLIHRVSYEALRPTLDQLKDSWCRILGDRNGFYLEDKGWSLAIHARYAEEGEAADVLESARGQAEELTDVHQFRVLGGHRFLEVGPRSANKGRSVDYILHHFPWEGAVPIYIGDDDKDEEAFEEILARGGIAIVVSLIPRESYADYRLRSPRDVQDWLRKLLNWLEK